MRYHKTAGKGFSFTCICYFMISAAVYSQDFSTKKSDEGLEVFEKGKKVLFYQNRPKSFKGQYERAGYVHPLYSLSEQVLTEDNPEDHPYHRGIFWAWHQVIWKRKKIADGWISENISWLPQKLTVDNTNKNLSIHSSLLWRCDSVDAKPLDIIKENTIITIHPATLGYRFIDFDIRLTALVDSLALGGADDAKGYGGFCLRLKLPDDISFISKSGTMAPQDTAINAAPWMDFIGSFNSTNGYKSGVLVFCYTSKTNQSQKWILRKQKSMQNVVYPGNKPAKISGKGWRLRYRLVIHDLTLTNVTIEKLYRQYQQEIK